MDEIKVGDVVFHAACNQHPIVKMAVEAKVAFLKDYVVVSWFDHNGLHHEAEFSKAVLRHWKQ